MSKGTFCFVIALPHITSGENVEHTQCSAVNSRMVLGNIFRDQKPYLLMVAKVRLPSLANLRSPITLASHNTRGLDQCQLSAAPKQEQILLDCGQRAVNPRLTKVNWL